METDRRHDNHNSNIAMKPAILTSQALTPGLELRVSSLRPADTGQVLDCGKQ